MAVEDWIDALARLWEIADGRGGTLKSYRSYERAEFPEALTVYPCALTYMVDVTHEYSAGGPAVDVYNGRTQFHLFPSAAKSLMPQAMRFVARIRNAAASSITLGGTVAHFALRRDVPSIEGPVVLKYGSEEPHIGLIVNWRVKENVSGDFIVSA